MVSILYQLRPQVLSLNPDMACCLSVYSPNLDICVVLRSSSRLTFLSKTRRKYGDNQRPLCHKLAFFYQHDSQTPLYRDLKAWVAAAALACFAIFGVFAGKDDDDSRLWGVFLGLGILLSGAEFVLIAKHYEILCFKRKEGVGAGNEHGGEESAGNEQGSEASA